MHVADRHKEKQITVYHSVSGQVVEASGLKGELGMLVGYGRCPRMGGN